MTDASSDTSKPAQQQPSVSSEIGAAAWGCAIAGFQGVLWILWMFILLKCAPMLLGPLDEGDMPLPAMSQMFITQSSFMASYWYLIALAGLLLAPLEIAIIASAAAWRKTWLLVLRQITVALFSIVPMLLLAFAIVAWAVTTQVVSDHVMQMLE